MKKKVLRSYKVIGKYEVTDEFGIRQKPVFYEGIHHNVLSPRQAWQEATDKVIESAEAEFGQQCKVNLLTDFRVILCREKAKGTKRKERMKLTKKLATFSKDLRGEKKNLSLKKKKAPQLLSYPAIQPKTNRYIRKVQPKRKISEENKKEPAEISIPPKERKRNRKKQLARRKEAIFLESSIHKTKKVREKMKWPDRIACWLKKIGKSLFS